MTLLIILLLVSGSVWGSSVLERIKSALVGTKPLMTALRDSDDGAVWCEAGQRNGLPLSSCPFVWLGENGFSPPKVKARWLTDEDLVLGLINPDTVLVIDHDTVILANIALMNNAQLLVRDCNFTLKGNIYASGNSRFSVESSNFVVPQDFIYQFTFAAMDSSEIEIRRSTFTTMNRPIGGAVAQMGKFVLDSVFMDNSFFTFALFDSGDIAISFTDGAGEFVMMGEGNLSIDHSDTILLWLTFPPNSSGEIRGSFGPDELVEAFSFPDSTCTGIPYSVEIDSVYNLIFAIMAQDSTDVCVYDAELLGYGNIFRESCADTISGLVDDAYYTDFSPSLPGRSIRLVNTSVRAWNLYAYGDNDLTIRGSIFGEFLADSTANVTIMNATCDGSGGHIGATGSSTMFTYYTTLFTDALMDGHSVSILLYTSFIEGQLIARNRALSLLFNTSLVNPILVFDSAAVMEIEMHPQTPAYVDDTLLISGSAGITRTEVSPFDYVGYKVEYAPLGDTMRFIPATDLITEPVYHDELCKISTQGFDVGEYIIRMWYFYTAYGSTDSLDMNVTVYLAPNTGVNDAKESFDCRISVFPNPFNSSCAVSIDAGGSPFSGIATVEIMDVGGRIVYSGEVAGGAFVWRPDEPLPNGLYLVKVGLWAGDKSSSAQESIVERIVLIR